MEIESNNSYQEWRRDRPYDARQPANDEFAMVLIPTDSQLGSGR